MRSEVAKWWRSAAGGLRSVVIGHIAPPPSTPHRRLFHTIQAVPRDITGSRVAARERAQGRIPSIVSTPPHLKKNPNNSTDSKKYVLTTDKKQIKFILKSVGLPFFYTTKYQLQIRAGAGSKILLESGTVLPLKIQRDQATGEILNLRFVWAEEGSSFNVNVPIVFKGEDVCPGLKKGGFLNKLEPSIRCRCPVEHIPQKFEVDVSTLEIGDKVFIRDVELHPSMELLKEGAEDTVLCCIGETKLADPEPDETYSADSEPDETNSADQEPVETNSAKPDPIKA